MSTATLTLTLSPKKAAAPKAIEIKDSDSQAVVDKKLEARKALLAKTSKTSAKTLVLKLAKTSDGAILVSTTEWTYKIGVKQLGGYNSAYEKLILGGDPAVSRAELIIDGTQYVTKSCDFGELLDIFSFVSARVEST